ncbi:MAG: hypoxanthine/guanine phosphoribosyltransferase [Candidatus Thermoplasmatota archaeon]
MKLKKLEESIYKAPIVKKGNYDYIVHPITDGVPSIEPGLLKEITKEFKVLSKKFLPFDRIVTMEAMGIPLASALSLETGIPFTIIRKREYGLPGEVSVEQTTGYSKSRMFINGLSKGDRIIIVDDVLSTGGTLRAVLSSLQNIGVVVKGVFIVLNKGASLTSISKEFNVPIITLVSIDIIDGKVIIQK